MLFGIIAAAALLLALRYLSTTSIFNILLRAIRSLLDSFHVYQSFKVPRFNHNLQQNQLYSNISTYLNSLPSLEDSDSTNLFTGAKANDIIVHTDPNQTIHDVFLGARVSWVCRSSPPEFELKLRKKDKRRILRPYLQHILSVANETQQKNRDIKLHMNLNRPSEEHGRWTSVPFTHPASLETLVIDEQVKTKIKADLETFLKSEQYYHKVGRLWKRSYLLSGAPGTGKSTFVVAMAKFLCFDIYDIDLSKVTDDADLKLLLLQTTPRSVIVLEDLDRYLTEKSTSAVSLGGVLNLMDGIVSSCGEERVLVFTVNSKDKIDPAATRPGRIDVHVQFPACDFPGFKNFANSYLGLKEHKLFPQVEEILQGGASLSHAEIGELMISNRSSPTRALKSIITALQGTNRLPRRPSESGLNLERSAEEVASDQIQHSASGPTVKEFRKLYGLLRGSRRKEELQLDLDSAQKDAPRPNGLEKSGSVHEVR